MAKGYSRRENLYQTDDSMSVPGRKQVDFEASDFVYEFVCDPCQEEGHQYVAFGFCSNCNHYLCKTCYTVHCRPLPTRNHNLLDKDRMPKNRPRLSTGNRDIDEKCEKHSGKIVEYFCKNHDAIGCSVCITLDHKLCDGVQFVQDLKVDKDKARMIMKELSTLNNNAKDKQERVKQCLALGEQSFHNAVQEAKIFCLQMKTFIEKLEKNFEETAQSDRDTAEECRCIEIDKLEKTIQQTESLSRDSSRYQSDDQESRLFIAMKQAEQIIASNAHVNDHEELKSNYIFMPNEDLSDLQDNIQTLGTVHVSYKPKDDDDGESLVFGTSINIKTTGDPYRAYSKDDTSDCVIVGVVSVNEPIRNIIADAGNNKIKVIKWYSDTLTTSLKIPSRPFAMAQFGASKVCVTMPEKKKIIILSISKLFTKDTIRITKSIQCGGKCFGIETDIADEEIMVVRENEGQFAIEVLDFESKTLKHFKCGEGNGIPRYLKVTGDHIYSLDIINGVLKKRARLNGLVENTCTVEQASNVAVTKNYLIVVTGTPQTLCVFDHNFQNVHAKGELCDKGDNIVCVGVEKDYSDSFYVAFSAGYVQEYSIGKFRF